MSGGVAKSLRSTNDRSRVCEGDGGRLDLRSGIGVEQHRLRRDHRVQCPTVHVRLELRNVVANYPFERSHRFPVIQPNSGRRDYSRSSRDGGRRRAGLVPCILAGCLRGVGRRGASPSWQELPRSATPIAKIGSKGPRDRAARTCRSLTLRSAFRRIAFVPLYRRKALLAGPVHDNKKHANTDRPHEPKSGKATRLN